MSVAIVAALPREIAGLVRRTDADRALLLQGIHLHRLPDAVVVAAGMGTARVTLAVQSALSASTASALISIGLAGACSPLILPGAVLEADVVIDVHTGERWPTSNNTAAQSPLVLASSASIAGVKEKQRLSDSYGAAMVDMEAAAVGRLAFAHGLSFRAIKAISDAHDFEIASLGRFTGRHGHFRSGRFAVHTALRPHTWPRTVRLGRHSSQALSALTKRLRQELHLTA